MAKFKFSELFETLTTNAPFPWQQALYERFVILNFPEVCQLPTGLGKTSIIAIWMAALLTSEKRLPRRLVYVVNRRTVVDQTTVEVEKLREKLLSHDLYQSKFGDTFGISTLRGQFADNREWCSDPSKPAVIAGTVDMIGSRLLFGGYGCGFKSRPLHAGFLGQDVLLIHDEAHLEPAFQTLLEHIQDEQKRCHEFGDFKVIQLSATTRGKDVSEEKLFRLTTDDLKHDYVQQRLHSTKKLSLHQIADEKKINDKLIELAIQHETSKAPVLIFVNTVKQVMQIQEQLQKKLKSKERVEILTGTMRGLERDELVKKPVFQHFMPESSKSPTIDQTVYLVSTSAGEVGVNISTRHLVSDLSTFESMAQRFGRVNRFGLYYDTQVDVVHSEFAEANKLSPLDYRRYLTLQLLQQLNGDASPAALGKLDKEACLEAYAPSPEILPVSDILFDKWSLTTIRGSLPGRPPLHEYLHGVSEYEPPQTKVAWRDEVGIITEQILEINNIPREELLEDYPLKNYELLQDQSKRVFDELKKLAKRRQLEVDPIWLIDETGTVSVTLLKKLVEEDVEDIYHKTLLLPPMAGGLEGGLFNGNAPIADDIADKWENRDGLLRKRIRGDESPPSGMKRVLSLKLKEFSDDDDELDESSVWNWYVRAKNTADENWGTAAKLPVRLDVHLQDVERKLGHILKNLNLELLTKEIREALLLTARAHDFGKRRIDWQKGIGNPEPTNYLAKSNTKMKPLPPTGYRHELGSLIDVQQLAEFQQSSSEMQDLILHIIAAHHGRARPHFPDEESYDPEKSNFITMEETSEVPRRFARLQRKYGRWGLAYLESLLRAADALASANPSATCEVNLHPSELKSEVHV